MRVCTKLFQYRRSKTIALRVDASPMRVGFRKFERCKWHIRLPLEQQQLHARRSVRMDREVHGSGERSGPVQLVETGTDAEAADFVHGDHLNIFEGTGEEFVLFHSASSFQMNLHHHAVRKLLWTWYSVVALHRHGMHACQYSGRMEHCVVRYTFIIHAKERGL